MAGLMSGMLVRGSVPVGAVTMVTGEPGIGKSLVAMHVAARVTRGIRMSPVTPEAGSGPVAAEDETEPMGVIVLSSVDRHDDTVLPRLIAAGADPSLVFFLKRKIWKAPVKGRKDSEGLEKPGYRSFRLSQDLEDLVWLPAAAYVLIVANSERLLVDEPSTEILWLIELLKRVCETWSHPIALGEPWDRAAVPFHVIFQVNRGAHVDISLPVAELPELYFG